MPDHASGRFMQVLKDQVALDAGDVSLRQQGTFHGYEAFIDHL